VCVGHCRPGRGASHSSPTFRPCPHPFASWPGTPLRPGWKNAFILTSFAAPAGFDVVIPSATFGSAGPITLGSGTAFLPKKPCTGLCGRFDFAKSGRGRTGESDISTMTVLRAGQSSILIASAWLAPVDIAELDRENRPWPDGMPATFLVLPAGRTLSESSDSVHDERFMMGGELARILIPLFKPCKE
jgi:hypothetical protein